MQRVRWKDCPELNEIKTRTGIVVQPCSHKNAAVKIVLEVIRDLNVGAL